MPADRPAAHRLTRVRQRPRTSILNGMNAATAPQYENSLSGARAWFPHNRLTRPYADRMIAGVTAGIARRYDVNLLVARIAMVAAAIALTPLIYVALWVLMPADDDAVELDG